MGKGDLVYVKGEGSKFNSREMYMVVAINGSDAIIQKFKNSKFMSRRYTVPLTQIYRATPMINETPQETSSSSSSSDDDFQEEEIEDEAVEYEEEEEEVADTVPDIDTHSSGSNLQRRSSRNRRVPSWQRSGDWVLD